MVSAPFRFDAGSHTYSDPETGEIFPHVTGMLKDAGWIDDRWYTEACRHRGEVVHRITADYDLGALALEDYEGPYRGWFLAHVKATRSVRPEWQHIETPAVHPRYRYGCRVDRAGLVYALMSVGEVKSGPPEPAHAIQTALQAIIAAETFALPPEALGRFTLYLKESGRFTLEQHKRRADFDEAYRLIRRFCS